MQPEHCRAGEIAASERGWTVRQFDRMVSLILSRTAARLSRRIKIDSPAHGERAHR